MVPRDGGVVERALLLAVDLVEGLGTFLCGKDERVAVLDSLTYLGDSLIVEAVEDLARELRGKDRDEVLLANLGFVVNVKLMLIHVLGGERFSAALWEMTTASSKLEPNHGMNAVRRLAPRAVTPLSSV